MFVHHTITTQDTQKTRCHAVQYVFYSKVLARESIESFRHSRGCSVLALEMLTHFKVRYVRLVTQNNKSKYTRNRENCLWSSKHEKFHYVATQIGSISAAMFLVEMPSLNWSNFETYTLCSAWMLPVWRDDSLMFQREEMLYEMDQPAQVQNSTLLQCSQCVSIVGVK